MIGAVPKTYRVTEPSRCEANDHILGHVEVEFAPGEVQPKNEAEEFALERLVEAGAAEPAGRKPSKGPVPVGDDEEAVQ